MPYYVGEPNSHGCKGFPVVKNDDGKVMGCHPTKQQAIKQLQALYLNEPNKGE